MELDTFIRVFIGKEAASGGPDTHYRQPLVGYADAGNPLFGRLKELVNPAHALPADILPGARTVAAFFLPFDPAIPASNTRDMAGKRPSAAWSRAYVETNTLIRRITAGLVSGLAEMGVRAAGIPPTHNFDPVTLVAPWAHKSVAVIAGLGSFGLHQMVITDAGCAGRFGSFVLDVEIPPNLVIQKERCRYFLDRSCQACVRACPVEAIHPEKGLDKQRCWGYLRSNARAYENPTGQHADVCGKCATGPCALSPAV